ncbi:hypothetical protein [Ferroplasma sp.]|uniref:hypothetical protein n=1 Tax=Ferroplasma sp. TaxID=2591003 RepID=UPI00307DE18C
MLFYFNAFQNKFIILFAIPLILTVLIAAVFTYQILKKLKLSHKRAAKYIILVFVMAYIFLESVFIIIDIHTPVTLLLLIPLNLVVMSLPIYIKLRTGKDSKPSGEYSQKLSERLKNLIGSNAPEVWISPKKAFTFGEVHSSDPIKIIIFESTMEELSDEELDTLMLELYYKKTMSGHGGIVYRIFLFYMLLIDGFTVTYLFDMNVPGKYTPYFLLVQFIILLLAVMYPRILLKTKFAKNYYAIDHKIMEIYNNENALVSLIQKESKLDFPGTFTARQYDRMNANRMKIADKRIKNIEFIN